MKGCLTIDGEVKAIYSAVSLAKGTVLSKAQSYRDVPLICLDKYRAMSHGDVSLLDDRD